jgi:hypothetical protein
MYITTTDLEASWLLWEHFRGFHEEGIKFTSTVFLYFDKLETDIPRTRLLARVGRKRLAIACGQSTRLKPDTLILNKRINARGKMDREHAPPLYRRSKYGVRSKPSLTKGSGFFPQFSYSTFTLCGSGSDTYMHYGVILWRYVYRRV